MQLKDQSVQPESAVTPEVTPTEQVAVDPGKPNVMTVINHLLASGWTHQDIRKKLGLNAHLMTRIFGMRISKHDNKKRITETARKRKRKLRNQAIKAARKRARNK